MLPLNVNIFFFFFVCCSLLQQDCTRRRLMDCLEKLFILQTRHHKLNSTIADTSADNFVTTPTLRLLFFKKATSNNCSDVFLGVTWLYLASFGDFWRLCLEGMYCYFVFSMEAHPLVGRSSFIKVPPSCHQSENTYSTASIQHTNVNEFRAREAAAGWCVKTILRKLNWKSVTK